MNIQLVQTIFFALAALAILVILFWMFRTEKRLKRFFLGKKAKDLEATIEILENDVSDLKSAKDKAEKALVDINQKLKKSIRGLETLRFNPFPDQGGNQSFALSMQNEEGDGVIISTLYSRDRNSVFAKPIKGGKSEYELTEEERVVLEKSKLNGKQ